MMTVEIKINTVLWLEPYIALVFYKHRTEEIYNVRIVDENNELYAFIKNSGIYTSTTLTEPLFIEQNNTNYFKDREPMDSDVTISVEIEEKLYLQATKVFADEKVTVEQLAFAFFYYIGDINNEQIAERWLKSMKERCSK